MSGYSDALAASGNGQQMALSLPGGYTLSYSIQRSGRQVSSSPLPLIPSAYIGTSGHYGGVAGRPGLYQVNRAVDPATSTTVRMTDITMRDAGGNAVHAFSIVGVDVEQTTTGETDTWSSDVPMTQIIPIGNACPGGFTGVGTTTVVCSSNNTLSRTGTAMLAAQDPRTMTQVMQNASTGVQGVAFAVLLPKVKMNKVVEGRIDPADDFTLSVSPAGGASLVTASTGTAATATTDEVPVIGPVAGSPFTLAETSSPGSLSGYSTVWSCTRNGASDASLPSGDAGSSVSVAPAIGDLIECTVTNTARSVGLTLQKYAGTPVDTNGNNITDPGDTIPYTFRLDNTGDLPLEDLAVTDPLVGAVSCPPGILAPGASVTCASVNDHVVTAADADRGAVVNEAIAQGRPSGSAATVESNSSATRTPVTVAAPALTVQKRASTSFVTRAGDSFTYAFDVTNTGNVTIEDVEVVEQSFTGSGPAPVISCPTTVLPATAAMTCTSTEYFTTQADVDAGFISNEAIAEGTADGPVSSAPSTVTITADQIAALRLEKSATPSDAASFTVGQEIQYSFIVTNTGNLTVSNIAIDELTFTGSGPLSPIECGPETAALEPGRQATCRAVYVLTQQDVDAGTLKNSATARGTVPDGTPVVSPESIVDLPADQAPALTVEKNADPTTATAAGQTIDYRFLVTNTGNVTLTGITVAETAFTGTGTPPAVTCPVDAASLLPGASTTCTATYETTLADVEAGEIRNTAVASANAPGGGSIDSPPSTATVTLEPIRALSLLKTGAPALISSLAGEVEYAFTVTNTGTVTLSGISIEETAFTGTGAAPVISCPAGAVSLAPAASVTCTAAYTPTQADLDQGSFSNTATASGTAPAGGGTVTSDPSTFTVTVDSLPNLTVIKTTTTTSVSAVGELIEYSFTVTNTGNVTLDDVRIVEGIFTGVGAPSSPLCPLTVLAPGEEMVCTSTVAVGQKDMDAGRVSNTASAAGVSPTRDDVFSPPSTVHVPAVSTPALSLQKTVDPLVATGVGATQQYTFTVTNTGNITLNDVVIVEGTFSGSNPPPVASCPAGAATLAPAATLVCTASYTVTQADVDQGTVTNTATAIATTPSTAESVASPSSEAVFSMINAPALTLVKSASTQVYDAGAAIEYSFLVTNDGNTTVTSITVDELAFSGTGAAPTVVCPEPTTLAPTETIECRATYTATPGDVRAGRIDNAATASGLTTGPTPSAVTSPPSSAVVLAASPVDGAALTLTKSADSRELAVFSAGDTITYRFVIANSGTVPISSVDVREVSFSGAGDTPDVVCPSQPTVLVPGESLVCSATYTLVAADAGVPSITNTASASGLDPNGDPIDSPTSTAEVVQRSPMPATGADPTLFIVVGSALAALGALALIVASRANRRRAERD